MKTVVFSCCSNLCCFPDRAPSVYLFTLGQWWWTFLSAKAESRILQDIGCRLGGASLFCLLSFFTHASLASFPCHPPFDVWHPLGYVNSPHCWALWGPAIGNCIRSYRIPSLLSRNRREVESPVRRELSLPWVPGQLKEGATQQRLISPPGKGLPSISRRETFFFLWDDSEVLHGQFHF